MKEECEKVGLKLNIQKTKIMASSPITSWQIRGKSRSSDRFSFLGLQNHYEWWLQPWNLKMLAPWKESYDKTRQCIKKQKHHFPSKCPYSQNYSFSSSHIRMWELDHKECWGLKNLCFSIVVLKKTPESPSDCKDFKPINPKWNQPWIFIGRTDAEAEAPILWPPDAKSWIIGKDLDSGKDWRQKEKGGHKGWDG